MSIEILEKNILYKFIYELVIKKIDLKPEIVFNDESTIVLKYEGHKKANFQICFWLNENRISCLLEEIEIIDEYIKNEAQASDLKNFIKEVLSHNVRLKFYKNQKDVLFKKSLFYTSIENEKIKLFSENQLFKIRFPWIKLSFQEKTFNSWIG